MPVTIVSKGYDSAVDNVVLWLTYFFKMTVLRIGADNNIHFRSFSLNNLDKIEISNAYDVKVDLGSCTAIWIHGCDYIFQTCEEVDDFDIKQQVEQQISQDYSAIFFSYIQFLHAFCPNVKVIGEFSDFTQRKIYQLLVAKNVGLAIPDSDIITDYDYLLALFKKRELITKSVQNSVYINTSKILVSGQRTENISASNVNLHEGIFHPSFVQHKIEKLYELRVFIFQNIIYSLAIFSQFDSSTRTDYRTWDNDKLRFVPYELPNEVKQRLLSLMNTLKLTTGSIDIIVTPNYEYVFLEINPCGQFSFVSSYCNYYIEKEIAQSLCNSN
ncbi:MAG: hypothetical protein BGO70_01180 [Bacteroidetes bacterium 43-93]|uniref:hypothetical protein n=1 Tax=uncultured Dysgonomonas sp. TaxID=206096 RepID=UPI0009273E75|nr:hypothetical protein [uncultured Dysgonomonas sp.]MBN9483111.1 hypothetical protein [Bacteroidota bacterium]OJW96325.1 MAG: hypothetical protein BGO70_01180 [Bacteroidetes bacterium 43-93]